MASCVRNICAKNYQNLLIVFQVTVENVGDVFLGHSVVVIGPVSATAVSRYTCTIYVLIQQLIKEKKRDKKLCYSKRVKTVNAALPDMK